MLVVIFSSLTAANIQDALRCNKVYNDNYYLGQICKLHEKHIDENTQWNQQLDDTSRPDQIKTVIFENSSVIYIPSQLFTKFKNVERVYLNGTKLEKVNEDSFIDARTVKEIYLNSNKLQEIKSASFSKASQCHILDLAYNLIDIIDSDAFEGLSQLRTLYLNNNRLKHLAEGTFNPLISLSVLELGNNNVEALQSSTFIYNRQIQKISLAYNSLRQLDLNLSNNNLIFEIDVSSNIIEKITIERKSDALKPLKIYASHNNWNCGVLNSTILNLELVDTHLEAKIDLRTKDKTNVNGIDCQAEQQSSFFNLNTDEVNWPIVLFVISCSIVFIVGAIVTMFCCRRKSRLYNYIYVLAK